MINKKLLAKSNILLIDSAPDEYLDVLANALDKMGVGMTIALEGEKAITLAKKSLPDAILLDVTMPDISGFEVCRRLQEEEITKGIPLIFMTSAAKKVDKMKGFEIGGVDYIAKPLQYEDVLARLNAHLTIHNQRKKIDQQERQLREMKRRLNLSKIDFLTQLPNRKDFMEKLEAEVKRCNRHSKSFVVILAEVDNFKSLTNAHGLDCGDFILEKISTSLKKMMRQYDHIARWGGEEFIVLLPETSKENGKIVAEGIRTAIKNADYLYEGKHHLITMTLGVSSYTLTDAKFDFCTKRAQIALFRGKQQGKDGVYME